MASKRIYDLTEVPGSKTGYSLAVDKALTSEAGMVMYEDIISEAVSGAAPVVSTPTITEVTDGDSVTATVSKKAVHGKTHAIQANFEVTLSGSKSQAYISFSGNSLGSVGQSLSCIVDNDPEIASCIVTDDSPLTVLVNWFGATKTGATNFYINGTLITTS